MPQALVSFDLHEAKEEGRTAFNKHLRLSKWTRYTKHKSGERRRMTNTTWMTTMLTASEIKKVLDGATNAANAVQSPALSVKRVVAVRYDPIYFKSPKEEKQKISQALADLMNGLS